MASRSRSEEEDEEEEVERWVLCGEEVRVNGEVIVEVVRMEEEGEEERREERCGLRATRRRRREPVVLRRGVKDWKRFVREEGMFSMGVSFWRCVLVLVRLE